MATAQRALMFFLRATRPSDQAQAATYTERIQDNYSLLSSDLIQHSCHGLRIVHLLGTALAVGRGFDVWLAAVSPLHSLSTPFAVHA